MKKPKYFYFIFIANIMAFSIVMPRIIDLMSDFSSKVLVLFGSTIIFGTNLAANLALLVKTNEKKEDSK